MPRGRKPKPAEERKVKNDLYLDRAVSDALTELAISLRVTKSQIAEEALREYLEKRGIKV
uniref:Putative regulatory protein n=1 Tax=Los Azufres archaeal virus 2 TaxID=1425359 RepID=A0A0A0P5X1_9VIRU|nr:putative regulatory protein [Los Azufres archaeal virus 2]